MKRSESQDADFKSGATDLDAYMPDVYETRQVLACANIGTLTRLSAYEVPYASPNVLYASRKHSRKYMRSPSSIYPLNQLPESCEIGLMGDCVLSQEVGRFQSVTEGTKHGCPRAATLGMNTSRKAE